MLARWTGDGVDAQIELRRDLAVRLPVADQLQHFELARGEAVIRARPSRPAGARHARIEHRLAGRHPLDGRRQVEIERVLQDVAARAGVERLPHQRVLGVHAEHQDRDVGRVARICRVAARPLVPGIAQSITTTRGFRRGGQADRFVAVAGFADHDDRRIVLEDAAEAAPDQAVIVGEQDGDRVIRHAAPPSAARVAARRQRHAGGAPACRPRAAAGTRSCRRPAPRARACATRPRPRRGGPTCRGRCRDPRLRARAPAPSKRSRTHACVDAGMARHVVQRFLQHAVDVDADRAVHGRRRARCARTTRQRRSAVPRVDRYQSIVLFEPGLLEDRRVQRLRQAADVVERRLRDLADLAQLGAAAANRPAPGVPARPSIDPIAVRTWPNSSCSSREISRSVDSRAAISCCASSRRSSESDASCANRRRFDRIRYRLVSTIAASVAADEPVDLPLHLAVDLLHAPRRLLFGFVVLDEQPRHRGAERRLPRLQRQPDLRARFVLVPVARQREDPVGRVPELRQRVAQVLALLGRAAAPRPPPLRAAAHPRDRAGCARTAPTRRSADTARRCRACRASPARARLRSFWMRSSCSESLRFRSARSVCSARSPEICRVMYHESADDGGQRDDQPEQQRRRRRSALRPSPVAHVTTSRRDSPSTARKSDPSSAARRRARASASRSDPGDSGCASRIG